jgi:aminoglycoside N3'-acetyltransferase
MADAVPRTMTARVSDWRELGVSSGDVVMVHASLRAIGPVADGASGVLDALATATAPGGALMMVLGAKNDWAWVNERPEAERTALLKNSIVFDAANTPAEDDVGYLAEALRQRPGVMVTNHPEGRFAAIGERAAELLRDPPWDDYYGPGSPLDHLCQMGGKVLRLGADWDTTTLLHFAEYLAPVPDKRRVRRHRLVQGASGPVVRVVDCLDDSDGIRDWPDGDYFAVILKAYVAASRGRTGCVGNAQSQLIAASDLVDFAVEWMTANLK